MKGNEPVRVWRLWDGEKCKVQVQFEPRDLWVGLFWRRSGLCLHFYITLIPLLPLHIVVTNDRWIRERAERIEAHRHRSRLCTN